MFKGTDEEWDAYYKAQEWRGKWLIVCDYANELYANNKITLSEAQNIIQMTRASHEDGIMAMHLINSLFAKHMPEKPQPFNEDDYE